MQCTRAPLLGLALLLLGACTGLERKDVERATALSQAGQDSAAEAALRALLQRRQGQPLPEDDALLVRSSLVPLLENQGRLGEAVELAQQVHREWLARRGERSPSTIAALGNLGRLYSAIGRLDQAVDAQEKSTRLAIEVLGAWHATAVSARNNLAATYLKLDRVPEALRLQESALNASRRTLGDRHPQTLLAQVNLARSYRASGQSARAEVLGREAAEALQEVSGAGHPATLAARAEQVASLAALGQGARALPLQEQLLAASQSTWGEQHRFTLEQLATMARLLAGAGRSTQALGLSARFIDGAETVRAQPGLARDDRRAMFAAYADDYRFFSSLHGGAGSLAEGFRLAELSKARTLLESMSEQSATRSQLLPAPDQAQLLQLEQALQQHEKAISEATDGTAKARAVFARDAELRTYERLVGELKARHPKFAQLRDPEIIAAERLPGLLPAGSAFVSYTVRGDGVAAWVTDDSGRLRFFDLGTVAGLADSVELLRRASSLPGGLAQLLAAEGQRAWQGPDGRVRLIDGKTAAPAGAVAVRHEAELARLLGQRLLQPLAEVLRGRRQWVVSPDGPLAQLPFELLTLDGRRVVEQVDVHYAQSLSVYALARALQQGYRGQSRPKDLLALGNPLYENDGQRAPEAVRARLRAQPVHSLQQLRETRLEWEPLPGTELEVQALQRLIPNGDTLLRAEASESRLQQLNRQGRLRDYRWLHFAVHGHLSTADPSLSALVLSQVGLTPDTDGYVTAAEWPGYDLRSDLTVLSACDTGLGRNVSGEGVMGLPFALFVAGNVNTVLTLWPVFDAVAPVFMEKYFARVRAGVPAAQALAETKRELAAQPRTSHPAYWAPFVLVGAG